MTFPNASRLERGEDELSRWRYPLEAMAEWLGVTPEKCLDVISPQCSRTHRQFTPTPVADEPSRRMATFRLLQDRTTFVE